MHSVFQIDTMVVLYNSIQYMDFHRDGIEVRTSPEVTFTIEFAPFKSLIQINLDFTYTDVTI